MEMGSKEHRYDARCLAKGPFRRILEHAMEQPPKTAHPSCKRSRALEGHAMFEPNRLAQQHLQDAYAYLVPPVHRYAGQARPVAKPAPSRVERRAQ